MPTSVTTIINLEPVPSAVPPLMLGGTSGQPLVQGQSLSGQQGIDFHNQLNVTWMQWFMNLREKVNLINANISGWSSIAFPLSAKGDLFTFTTIAARLGVGPDGATLQADSTQATGMKWVATSGGGGSGAQNVGLFFCMDAGGSEEVMGTLPSATTTITGGGGTGLTHAQAMARVSLGF